MLQDGRPGFKEVRQDMWWKLMKVADDVMGPFLRPPAADEPRQHVEAMHSGDCLHLKPYASAVMPSNCFGSSWDWSKTAGLGSKRCGSTWGSSWKLPMT